MRYFVSASMHTLLPFAEDAQIEICARDASTAQSLSLALTDLEKISELSYIKAVSDLFFLWKHGCGEKTIFTLVANDPEVHLKTYTTLSIFFLFQPHRLVVCHHTFNSPQSEARIAIANAEDFLKKNEHSQHLVYESTLNPDRAHSKSARHQNQQRKESAPLFCERDQL